MEDDMTFTLPTTVITLFERVVGMALAAGREFRLESKDEARNLSALGPLGKNDFFDRGLVLHVYGPEGLREEESDDGDGAGPADQGSGGGAADGE